MTENPFPTTCSCQTCTCHYLDTQKMTILLWKRDDYNLLKIANQRFISSVRVDKKGERYWKFRNCSEAEFNVQKPTVSEKFPERQEASNSSNQETNEQTIDTNRDNSNS